MKNYLLFLLIPFVFAANSCAQDDPFLDEIENPSILRSSEIVVSDSHLAFTSITGNADRSRIVLTYRSGSEHASFDGRILQITSNNRGRSWSSPIEIYSADGKDARDPQLFAVSDSELLCRFFERESEAVSHVKVLRSKNFGRTYEGTSTLPFPTESETFAAARGNMVMVDGVIYTICYNRWAQAWLVASDDHGRTWRNVSWVDEALGTQQSPYPRFNEASLGYIDGMLYCVARTNVEDGNMLIGESSDLGATWTWQYLPIRGHAPSLTPHDGGFILTYRLVNSATETYDFQLAFIKNGDLSGEPVSLFTSLSFDIGYGDVLTMERSFLVCCYQPNKIKCYEVGYDIFK